MTYEQFLDGIHTNEKKFNIGQWNDFYLTDDGTDEYNRILCKKWVSGGKEGGSCWGTEPYNMESESEPEFIPLTNILTHYAPALTFLQYQKITELQKNDTINEGEYYGNYTVYAIKYINLEELYNLLVEWRYIENV